MGQKSRWSFGKVHRASTKAECAPLNIVESPVGSKISAELRSDGWKDDSKNPITGVNISANGKGQLILSDYLAVNEEASVVAEQATDLIHWILSHDHVRKVFDDAQHEKNFVVLVHPLANITWWTTHYVAFHRLLNLKAPLWHAAYLCREEIIKAQLGRLYRHFAQYSNKTVSKGMLVQLEKRWATLDQPLFIFCLILNPYECLPRFGDKAGLNVFALNTEIILLYRHIRSRPRDTPRDPEEDAEKEKAVSTAFMQYLAGTGDFAAWQAHKEEFQKQHPDNPQLVWKQLKSCPDVTELAHLASLLLRFRMNQAPNERDFSDIKVKKTRLCNRLKTDKLHRMSKLRANIRAANCEAGLVDERAARSVHNPTRAAGLLAVPLYADLLEDESNSPSNTKLIKSSADWHVEMAKWVKAMQESEENEDEEAPASPRQGFMQLYLSMLTGDTIWWNGGKASWKTAVGLPHALCTPQRI
ncbi:hypothetical protein C8J57DRAFT_1513796 [Mycena rebaudengoi]|nr:hypothetical protein C8J57DRAFT_1513796 [Mycena rebaudengoi]